MKLLTFVIAALGMSATAFGAPQALECVNAAGDFKLVGTLDSLTGDIAPDSVKVTAAGVEKPATVKQFMHYDNDLFMIVSLGADQAAADTGYILDVERSDDSGAVAITGDVSKYSVDAAAGTRVVDKANEMKVSCTVQ